MTLVSNLRISVSLKADIGVGLLSAEGLPKEAGHEIAGGDLVPEHLIKGTGSDIVVNKHLIIGVAGIGVSTFGATISTVPGLQ